MINTSTIKFSTTDGLVPCIVQDSETRIVLMLGYMNKEAVEKTIQTDNVTFFSRSKQRLWTKGETSGHFLALSDMKLDCDSDTILVSVKPAGPACHTGDDTCFKEINTDRFLFELEKIIQHRKANPKQGSYTNTLLNSGINKVAQKVGEEAVELIIESKDDNRDLFLNEAADLMYHVLVLLTAKGFTMSDVEKVLAERHQKR